MQKALTNLALASVCIAATSVAYYYSRYLPRPHDAQLAEQRRTTELERAQRCHADAAKFYQDFRKNMSSVSTESLLDPEMHFSNRLNTCLIKVGWDRVTGGRLYRTESVTDIYSNREIVGAYYAFEGGEAKPVDAVLGGTGDPKKYFVEKDKLFRE